MPLFRTLLSLGWTKNSKSFAEPPSCRIVSKQPENAPFLEAAYSSSCPHSLFLSGFLTNILFRSTGIFGLRPSSVKFYKLENATFRKLDLFPSSGDWGGKTPTLLLMREVIWLSGLASWIFRRSSSLKKRATYRVHTGCISRLSKPFRI
jgi:hypothetical protein